MLSEPPPSQPFPSHLQGPFSFSIQRPLPQPPPRIPPTQETRGPEPAMKSVWTVRQGGLDPTVWGQPSWAPIPALQHTFQAFRPQFVTPVKWD